MSVDHRKVFVVVFLTDEASRILAEGSDLVAERLRIADKLGFIEVLVHFLHDFVSHFYTHTDVNGSRLVCNPMLFTYRLQPKRTSAPGADDGLAAFNSFFFTFDFDNRTCADAVFNQQIPALAVKVHCNALAEKILFDFIINFLRFFCSQMSDWAVYKLQPGFDGALSDFLNLFREFNSFDSGIGSEFEINAVGIVNQFLRKIITDKFRKVSAYIR